jgi:hypothetical protein
MSETTLNSTTYISNGDRLFTSIRTWADDTFGPVSDEKLITRAWDEWDELIDEYSKDDTPDHRKRVLSEAADVVICLARMPGLWQEIEHKHITNLSRRWRSNGDGTGQHIKDEQ